MKKDLPPRLFSSLLIQIQIDEKMIFCWKYGSKEKWHHIYFEVHNKNLFWCLHKNGFTKKFREMDLKKKIGVTTIAIASSKLAYNQISLFDWHFGRWHLWYYFPSSLVNLASHSIFVNISTDSKVSKMSVCMYTLFLLMENITKSGKNSHIY